MKAKPSRSRPSSRTFRCDRLLLPLGCSLAVVVVRCGGASRIPAPCSGALVWIDRAVGPTLAGSGRGTDRCRKSFDVGLEKIFSCVHTKIETMPRRPSRKSRKRSRKPRKSRKSRKKSRKRSRKRSRKSRRKSRKKSRKSRKSKKNKAQTRVIKFMVIDGKYLSIPPKRTGWGVPKPAITLDRTASGYQVYIKHPDIGGSRVYHFGLRRENIIMNAQDLSIRIRENDDNDPVDWKVGFKSKQTYNKFKSLLM